MAGHSWCEWPIAMDKERSTVEYEVHGALVQASRWITSDVVGILRLRENSGRCINSLLALDTVLGDW